MYARIPYYMYTKIKSKRKFKIRIIKLSKITVCTYVCFSAYYFSDDASRHH